MTHYEPPQQPLGRITRTGTGSEPPTAVPVRQVMTNLGLGLLLWVSGCYYVLIRREGGDEYYRLPLIDGAWEAPLNQYQTSGVGQREFLGG